MKYRQDVCRQGQRFPFIRAMDWRMAALLSALWLVPGPGPGMATPALARPLAPTELKQAVERPPVPLLPEDIPASINPDPAGITGLNPAPNADLGVAHLRPDPLPIGGTSQQANWLRGVALPIYASAEGDHWGWLVNGWLIPNGYNPIAVGRDATFFMVEAYDQVYSFPVLEIREDGWFSFQYTPAGTAWAHTSQLDIGPTELTLESWDSPLAAATYVKFRRHGISQSLREAPDGNSTMVSLVSPNSLIEPLEVDGDWVRVQVTQPATACAPRAGANQEEGWLRWRGSEAENLLVWFNPNRCEAPDTAPEELAPEAAAEDDA